MDGPRPGEVGVAFGDIGRVLRAGSTVWEVRGFAKVEASYVILMTCSP